jgi:hypothetical protein
LSSCFWRFISEFFFSLELRWKSAQNDRDRINYISDAVNLSGLKFFFSVVILHLLTGTPFGNISDIAISLLELRYLVKGEGADLGVAAFSLLEKLVSV